jgi:hypothetical protein
MLRKLLTKPVWWWERKRNYPVRSRFTALPPLPVQKAPKRFVVLTTPKELNDAMWTAWSWYRYLRFYGFELQIAMDGNITDAEGAAARQLFPGVSVCAAKSVCHYVCEREPRLAKFLYHHPTGRKFALMLALSDQRPVLYSDQDVLAFNIPDELLSCIERDVPCYFMEEVDGTRDPLIVERAYALGLDYIPKFNCGFLYIPKGTLPMDAAARLLETWRPPGGSWFAEQTILSVMLRDANTEALPPSRYVISNCRQFYWEKDVDYTAIAARHFTGTVRHVMYKRGMPIVLSQSKHLQVRINGKWSG